MTGKKPDRRGALLAGLQAEATKVAPKVDPKVKGAEPLHRTTITMPISDRTRLEDLEARAMSLGALATKSTIVRAGFLALERLGDEEFRAAVERAPPLPVGRKPRG